MKILITKPMLNGTGLEEHWEQLLEIYLTSKNGGNSIKEQENLKLAISHEFGLKVEMFDGKSRQGNRSLCKAIFSFILYFHSKYKYTTTEIAGILNISQHKSILNHFRMFKNRFATEPGFREAVERILTIAMESNAEEILTKMKEKN